jgi:para-nitrobenzyl esterase
MTLSRAASPVAIALCLLCEASWPTALAQPSQALVVAIADGSLKGELTSTESAIFRGIPYAAPPLGQLRWRAPQPPKPWTGVRDASRSAPPCAQASVGWNSADAARGAEDCLYIDVRTPRLDPKARLPVLVWIHGGANWAGSPGFVVDSALADRGIVVVTIQYRLGIFGFLSHPHLSSESPDGVSGNYALMDQIAGLKWVQRNIAAFGGDPHSVTIAGHSAGGEDVGLLMLAPGARGLFARAIQQSGTAGFGLPPRSLAENESLGRQFASLAGVPAGNGDIAALRALPAGRLLDAQMMLETRALTDQSYIFLQAVVDRRIVPASPEQLLRAGKSAPVPLMIGNSAQEIALGSGDSSVWRIVARGFGDSAPAARALYGLGNGLQPADDPLLGNLGVQVADDLTFRCPAAFTADQHARTGQPVWRYQMEQAAPGAARIDHGSELTFIFDNLPLDPAVDARQPVLPGYWVNFIRSGDPNGDGLPRWPRYGPGREYMRFTAHGPVANRGLRTQICALLERP